MEQMIFNHKVDLSAPPPRGIRFWRQAFPFVPKYEVYRYLGYEAGQNRHCFVGRSSGAILFKTERYLFKDGFGPFMYPGGKNAKD